VLELICYLVAVVLFVLAAFRVTTRPVDLLPLGLAFAAFPLLYAALQSVN